MTMDIIGLILFGAGLLILAKGLSSRSDDGWILGVLFGPILIFVALGLIFGK